ncbi:uncharacterized protein LOC117481622 isoform X4 [Trematomus bernacchii]|uniref:uncharacterized protein LOC117481622 isoform X4 n=1 Tax=Trematomus bernacchii TaxID=40690 RepID=UPI00146E29AA|nr:uncharacterized protein LOC117481622 isoform X4 [Trematomus bernacchii]
MGSGVVSFSHGWTSGSELEMTVRPGENITLYCDCKSSTGVYIVWYRNCSHENQPSLVLDKNVWTKSSTADHIMNPLPRFHFVRNFSSDTYDLLIINITETDEGLYYCGTEQLKVEKEEHITRRHLYKYGNISTKIQFTVLDSSEPDHQETPQDCNGVCWMLLFSLCPAVAALSSLLSSLLVYHLCKKEEPQTDQQTPQTRQNQDEDVCYAAVEIRPASQRPKKKTTQSSVTYSAINTSRM